MDYYMGTEHSANAVRSAHFKKLFRRFQKGDLDFGMAYGMLRPFWSQQDFAEPYLHAGGARAKDNTMRSSACARNRISPSNIPPRRVWDLLSNRVLDWCSVNLELRDVWPVSHSWVSPDERETLLTPINQEQWPVPVPREVDLDDVRLELILYGAEYAWLDVLCLRQKGFPKREKTRKEEWALDVPTIGYIYEQQANVVTYLSGLGRPFNATPTEDKQHWLSRAWTLQEIVAKACYIGGLRHNDVEPLLTPDRVENVYEYNEIFNKVAKTIHFRKCDFDLFDVLGRMRTRHAVHERDKVAGLAYILRYWDALPCYEDHEDPEAAWIGVVNTIDKRYISQLLFLFPEPGDICSGRSWLPSWYQIRTATRLPHLEQDVDHCLDRIRFKYIFTHQLHVRGYLLDSCTVHGLDNSNFNDPRFSLESEALPCRCGWIKLKHDGGSHTVVVKAHHQIAVPSQERLALIGTEDFRYCVVCKAIDEPTQRIFEKVTVVTIPDRSDRMRAARAAQRRQWLFII
ncbi:hypothetical protein EIP86_004980 [Pleurotus ostreatoroseus]|nr:hypothetical protein EIP86_004980 [Pleurotus ostreatoroseus]